jgi:NAD(P)-dependent dehydrogenase (short-subunit alcohol dehydrogenase family)
MMTTVFSVEGRTAVITGASSGIGLGLCHAFSRAGANVVGISRSAKASAPLLADFEGKRGAIVAIDADVTREGEVVQVVESAAKSFGPLDVLINNAGMVVERPTLEATLDDWNRQIGTNLTGPFLLSKAFVPHMAARGGSIINISSVAAFRAMRKLAAYAASKAGLIQLTRVMALELSKKAIRVNTIVPGYIRTPMNGKFLDSDHGKTVVAGIPLGRAGDGDDIANAAIFLASEASSYMTGSVLTVDGGFLLH